MKCQNLFLYGNNLHEISTLVSGKKISVMNFSSGELAQRTIKVLGLVCRSCAAVVMYRLWIVNYNRKRSRLANDTIVRLSRLYDTVS